MERLGVSAAADVLYTNEGKKYLDDNGFPATVYVGLSTKKVGTQAGGEWNVTDTLADIAENTGTSYTRKSMARPTSTSGIRTWPETAFNVPAAGDWSANVRSFFLLTTNDGAAKVLCAVNILAGGGPVALNSPQATVDIAALTTFLANVWE